MDGHDAGCTALPSASWPDTAQHHLLRVRALLPPAGLRAGGRRRRAWILGLRALEQRSKRAHLYPRATVFCGRCW